jgi:hypothetical protein
MGATTVAIVGDGTRVADYERVADSGRSPRHQPRFDQEIKQAGNGFTFFHPDTAALGRPLSEREEDTVDSVA